MNHSFLSSSETGGTRYTRTLCCERSRNLLPRLGFCKSIYFYSSLFLHPLPQLHSSQGEDWKVEFAMGKDEDGKVTFTWERSLVFDGEWKASDGKDSALPATISLADDTVEKVDVEETAKDLWGEGKADPKESLTSNGFKMRRVVLTTKRRG